LKGRVLESEFLQLQKGYMFGLLAKDSLRNQFQKEGNNYSQDLSSVSIGMKRKAAEPLYNEQLKQGKVMSQCFNEKPDESEQNNHEL